MNEIDRICKDLKLPRGDFFTQDWAYELPEEFRTTYWLKKYISAYLDINYSKVEKNALMTLMLDVSNDLLTQGVDVSDELIVSVLNLLLKNHHCHFMLIDYWSLEGEPLEDCFALTPAVRNIKNQIR
ncbi:hypothetical protein [Pseudomonas sp. LD120]|uniref:hypothetical protein n=1 Tax=Pseudomonas sp. LD120 TaxID=485751 RepID=UPI00135CA5EE|nr:hypothetical protein [Pseudomonas sp. LD120]KAF0866041.1 hypothetical protein PLD_12505 [Pseudomonas sp. LD120]